MVELNIKKLLGLKSLNCISDKELRQDLADFKKEDFIDFLVSIPKESISFLFEEKQETEEKVISEDVDI